MLRERGLAVDVAKLNLSQYGSFTNAGATLFEGPFKGILFYLGYKRGTPILGNAQIPLMVIDA